MLDDGETQARAPIFARPATVYSIKPLGQTRNMLGSNTLALVLKMDQHRIAFQLRRNLKAGRIGRITGSVL